MTFFAFLPADGFAIVLERLDPPRCVGCDCSAFAVPLPLPLREEVDGEANLTLRCKSGRVRGEAGAFRLLLLFGSTLTPFNENDRLKLDPFRRHIAPCRMLNALLWSASGSVSAVSDDLLFFCLEYILSIMVACSFWSVASEGNWWREATGLQDRREEGGGGCQD